jgi:hypothetical protein
MAGRSKITVIIRKIAGLGQIATNVRTIVRVRMNGGMMIAGRGGMIVVRMIVGRGRTIIKDRTTTAGRITIAIPVIMGGMTAAETVAATVMETAAAAVTRWNACPMRQPRKCRH